MKRYIHISAGTYERSGSVSFPIEEKNKNEKIPQLDVGSEEVTISYEKLDFASGGKKGQYPVTRTAKVTLPISYVIELCAKALSQSGYELSPPESKTLLRAIAQAIPSR